MLKEKTFNTGAVNINYVEGPPANDPLVLLHGVASRWQCFLSVMPFLSTRSHVYALDFRGHGRSGHVSEPYLLEGWAEDAAAFLQQHIRKPAVLFGHSLGGMVSLMIASNYPEAVRAVVVGDSPLFWESLRERRDFYHLLVAYKELALSRPPKEEMAALIADILLPVPGEEKPIRVGAFCDTLWCRFEAECLARMDPEVLTGFIKFLEGGDEITRGYQCDVLLRKVTCPVLLLQGNPSLGAIITDSNLARATSLLSHVTHVRIEHAGHNLGLDTWDTMPILRAVTLFLDSL